MSTWSLVEIFGGKFPAKISKPPHNSQQNRPAKKPHFTMFMHKSPMLGHPALIEHSLQWFEVLVYVVEYCEEQVC